jgi:ankyrin repeat protein
MGSPVLKFASPNEPNGQNVTPLHVAAATCGTHEQSEDVIHVLLSSGGDPNVFDKRGLSPLHMLAAARLGSNSSITVHNDDSPGARLANACVQANAQLNLQTRAGNKMTALHIAVENNNYEFANALVRNGAAVSIPDSGGRCALSMCVGHAREVDLRRSMLLSNVTRAPFWVPDEALSNCMECGSEFSFSKRRSHCRHCGRLVCKSCAPKKSKILKLGENKPVRVCNPCLDVSVNPTNVTDVGGVGVGGSSGGQDGFPAATGGK